MSSNENHDRQEERVNIPNANLSSRIRDEGFWKELWYQVKLIWYLIRDPEVPIYLKLLPMLAVLYVLVPTDLFPDLFPVVGQLDDVTALIVGGKVFIELSPTRIVTHYARLMREQVADLQNVRTPDAGAESLADKIVIEGEFEETEEK